MTNPEWLNGNRQHQGQEYRSEDAAEHLHSADATTVAAIPSRTIKPRGIDQFSLPDSVGIGVGASTAGFPFLENTGLENTGFLCPAPDLECSHDHEEAEQDCVPTNNQMRLMMPSPGAMRRMMPKMTASTDAASNHPPNWIRAALHLEGADNSEDSEHDGVEGNYVQQHQRSDARPDQRDDAAPTETTPVNTHQPPHELRCSRSRMARTIVIKPSAME